MEIIPDDEDVEEEEDSSCKKPTALDKGINVRVWKMSLAKTVVEEKNTPATAVILKQYSCQDSLLVQIHLFSKDLREAWRKYSAARVSKRPQRYLQHLVEHCLSSDKQEHWEEVPPFLSMLMVMEATGQISKPTVQALIKVRNKIQAQLLENPAAESTQGPKNLVLRCPLEIELPPQCLELDLQCSDVNLETLLTCLVKGDVVSLKEKEKNACAAFLSYFFEVKLQGSLSEFQEEKYNLFHFVSQHAVLHTLDDCDKLKAALRGRFWVGKNSVSAELEDLAVEVARRVLLEEWSCALKEKGTKKLIKLRHGSYKLDVFHRVVQAVFLLRYDCKYLEEQLQAETDLCQDLLLLKTFAERCLARFKPGDTWTPISRDDDLVQEILDSFNECPLLITNAPLEFNLEILGALRVFFRVLEAKKDGPGGLIDHLEALIFTPTFSQKHFVSRLPVMLLGHIWPLVYELFHERVVLQMSLDELTKLVTNLDQAMLFRVLLYKPCGAPFEDLDESRKLLEGFVKKLDCLAYHDFNMCTRDASKALLSEHAKRYYFFLSTAEQACWNDHRAQDVLQQIFKNSLSTFFAAPFGNFRFTELSRRVGKGGIALMCVPNSSSNGLSADCIKQCPLSLRVFARCHADYFSLLPMIYRTGYKDLSEIIKRLHNLNISCWCVGKFQEVQVLQQRHQLFPFRHITMNKNCQLESLFKDPNDDLLNFLGEVEEVQHKHTLMRISQTETAVQTADWVERLTDILKRADIDVDIDEKVNAVLFEEDDFLPLMKNGILTLSRKDVDNSLQCELLQILQERRVAIFQQRLCGRIKLLYKLRESGFSPCYRYGIVLYSDWLPEDISKVEKHVKDANKVLKGFWDIQ